VGNDEQRRIDRILAADYLGDLGERSTSELRAMREECEEEETGLSYARRVVHGRLDILRAEALRREEQGDDPGEVLAMLPAVLGSDGHSSDPLTTRAPRRLVPPHVQYHRRGIDTIADDEALGMLSERTAEDLSALVDRLRELERDLSTKRRTVLDHIDAIQAELVARYKSGSADVREVLTDLT
jgi:hypothetical protein